MKINLRGEIVFRNLPNRRGLKRLVQRDLEAWAKTHRVEWIADRLYFLVSFTRIPTGANQKPKVGCHVEIIGRNDVWIGTRIARNAQEAFSLCIHKLGSIRAEIAV